MNWTRNVGSRLLCLAALTAVLPTFGQDASLLGYDGPDRVQKAIAAAQKEGSFTLYTSFAEKDLPPLLGAFEKRYGIKVRCGARSRRRCCSAP
jgi:iron(III) transport system substrate-binding protein